MSAKRYGRMHRATALVPLALLSAAWTANLVGVGSPVAMAGDRPNPTLPDGTSVPAQAIQAPASVSTGDVLGPGVGDANAEQIVATASTSGIPSAALAAYQRAETVINAADKGCNLTWQLIAAIGRVESNHGRADGNTLNDQGIATPGIFGRPLNGANGTTEIADTDAGQYDSDQTYDRAVGPMQFIPSTWSVVGVDADGDGVRNPQDINDAALGTAVYLCSGSDDLSTDAGQRSAVFRYNHSQSYVDLVLAIAQAYTDGDFTAVPNDTVMAGELVKSPPPVHIPNAPAHHTQLNPPHANTDNNQSNGPSDTTSNTSDGPSDSPTTSTGNNQGNGSGGGVHVPGTQVSVPPLPSTSLPPVDATLTLVQATAQCVLDGLNQLLDPTGFQQCLDHYMNPHHGRYAASPAGSRTDAQPLARPTALPTP